MTERTVAIRVEVDGAEAASSQLANIIQQRDALLKKSSVSLNLDQARRSADSVSAASSGAVRDMNALASAIAGKAIAPLQQYQAMLSGVVRAGTVLGPSLVSSLSNVSTEFQRQVDLAKFWGTSGYMYSGVNSLKAALGNFVATSGSGFTRWLEGASASLTRYRAALVVAAGSMISVASAAAMSSKASQNYIQSTLNTGLMQRKLTDRAAAETWIQEAQGVDWSAGRGERMGTFQTILARNPYISQEAAQRATEDFEKYYYANQEMLKKKGVTSAEQLALEVSSAEFSQDRATELGFALDFAKRTPQARMGYIREETSKYNMEDITATRPEQVLSKRLTATTAAMGDAVIPVLNKVLGAFIKLSDVIGKIPGLGAAMGWAAVLTGVAASALLVVSVIGSLVPGLMTVVGLMQKASIATRMMSVAQWALNVAMSANPLGIVIIAVAALVASLYVLEKKFGLVTKAWHAFSDSSIGKGIIGYIESGKKALKDMLDTIGSGGLSGVLKIGFDALMATSPVLKTIASIVDFLWDIWSNGSILNDLISAATTIWQKMEEFLRGLWNTIQGGVQYIKDGLGITKKEAETKYEKAVETAGGIRYYNEKNKKGWYTPEGTPVPEDQVPSYLTRAFKEYQESPASVIDGLWNWLIGGFQDLIEAIKNLPGTISAAIKSWFPGAGGSEDKDRSPAETQAGLAVEAKAPGAYVMGPNSQKISPSQWPMQYLFDRTGEFGSKTVYGPGGAELGTVQDFMTREAAMDTLLQAAKADGKPSDVPGISFSEDTWLDLLNSNRQTYPAAQELYDRLASSSEGVEIKSDKFGNEYLAPTAPETFKNQGTMYVSPSKEYGKQDVWNASGPVKTGFATKEEAQEYINNLTKSGQTETSSLAKGGQIEVTGLLIGHGGEEVNPAKVVVGGKTTLEKINDMFLGGAVSRQSIMFAPNTTININVDKINSDVDLEKAIAKAGDEFDRKLLFRLRGALESTSMRGIGYLRG